MKKIKETIRSSKAGTLFGGFSPGVRAAFILVLPYTVVDALHYYTAGTALIFSAPVVILLLLLCGSFAARFALADGVELDEVAGHGQKAGVLLWLSSTVINSVIAVIVGAASFGWTLLLGIPFLLLCGPVLMVGAALGGQVGAVVYRELTRRVREARGKEDVDQQSEPSRCT